tara:strand:- start:78 stop:503 length:426 start_codon:yes stop_codon:yes gene_type:complete
MLVFSNQTLESIKVFAEREYPYECCGLLIGKHTSTDIQVKRHISSPNVTREDKRETFEIDPKIRFSVMRDLEDGSGLSIIGHYHSHPDEAAIPSKKDLEMVFEPELVWVILSVIKGSVIDIVPFIYNIEQKMFDRLQIKIN